MFINVISTKRSGHHAFIEWLRRHHQRRVTCYNNARVTDAIALCHQAPRTPLVLNYEGLTPRAVRRIQRAQDGAGAQRLDIVFLRDPLNMIASTLARKASPRREIAFIARQVFAEAQWLESRDTQGALVHVSYSRWLSDEAYRGAVARRLALSGEALPDAVTPHGGGSSFGGPETLGETERRARLTRWHAFRHDPVFRAIAGFPPLRAVFETVARGGLPDTFGATFRSEAEAALLARLGDPARHDARVARALHRLHRRRAVFEAYDHAGPARRGLIKHAAGLAAVI